MGRDVSLWFEFASTYSYPAVMQAEDAAASRGVVLRWKPMLLGPIFAAQGLKDSPFLLNPLKGAYMWRDLERICEAADLPFTRPSRFPRGSLLASRVACRFSDAAWISSFIRAVYSANFAADRAIDDPEVVADILTDLALDADSVIEAALAQDNKDALRAQTERALKKGIFGAPMAGPPQ